MEYKNTLNLKPSPLSQKARLPELEPKMLDAWERADIYSKIIETHAGDPLYILHDGPPYANGSIHLGTAMNKIIKDMVVKSKSMAGHLAPYVPGWDCHGLPIEHKVTTELGDKARELSKSEIQKRCRAYASKWIDIQRKEFKRLGVFGDWENPYLTMKYEYEAVIMDTFAELVGRGSVYRGAKPIHWCTHCFTALAEAEVEYADHASPSITVKFKLEGKHPPELAFIGNRDLYLVIWTTTPWTLPANNAIAMHPDFDYVAVEVDGDALVVAEGLLNYFLNDIGKTGATVLGKFKAKALEGRKAIHPLHGRHSLVILGDFVTLEAGSGLVHIAPGHGQEDFEVGQKYGLPVYAPVDESGRFTDDVEEFAGMEVFAANKAIIESLRRRKALLDSREISHSYPHCWRCKNPVIFRSTPQWFVTMDSTGLRKNALEAIETVQFIPPWGQKQISDMVRDRTDWCISRQRAWGVPIAAFYCECGEVLLSADVTRHVARIVEKEGVEAWFSHSESELLPPGTECPKCGGTNLKKEMDILDVWFDSGVSWAAVCEKHPQLTYPVNLYLEGKDQHRGWFQSSLLTSVGARNRAPYKAVMTCGFVVDENDRPYSKSSGNYVPLEDMITQYGAEIIRLWVASSDYKEDVRMSDETMKRLSDAYRKIRNTARFMVGNLYDFDPDKNSVKDDELTYLDKWIMARYRRLAELLRSAYSDFEFHRVYHFLLDFCTVDLSAIYLDILKDRLYCDGAQSKGRRAAQTVMWNILIGLLKFMAPVITFTADEIWLLIRRKGMADSVHLTYFPDDKPRAEDTELLEKWDRLLRLRAAISKALEEARKKKTIGSSQEARVLLTGDGALLKLASEDLNLIREMTISSIVEITDKTDDGFIKPEDADGLLVKIEHATGKKCQRCWNWWKDVGPHGAHEEICDRCARVLTPV